RRGGGLVLDPAYDVVLVGGALVDAAVLAAGRAERVAVGQRIGIEVRPDVAGHRALANAGRRHGEQVGLAEPLAQRFGGGEEERPAGDDRPADGIAELVARERRLLLVEIILRV